MGRKGPWKHRNVKYRRSIFEITSVAASEKYTIHRHSRWWQNEICYQRVGSEIAKNRETINSSTSTHSCRTKGSLIANEIVGVSSRIKLIAFLLNMMTSSNGNIFRVTGPLCGEFTGPGEFPTQRSVTRSFDVYFDLRLNIRLSEQPWGWWFDTPSWSGQWRKQ